jgi:hypothetical protein
MFSGYPTSSVARHGSHIESSFLGNGNTQESGLRNGSSVAVVLHEVDDQREDDSSKSIKRKKKKSRGNGMRSTWIDFRMRRRSAAASLWLPACHHGDDHDPLSKPLEFFFL